MSGSLSPSGDASTLDCLASIKMKAFSILLLLSLFASLSVAAQRTRNLPPAVISTFSALPIGITFQELLRRAGSPDGDIGSGIYIYRYYLADGTFVLVGTPDRKRILYIIHVAGSVCTQLLPTAK
jgi:hypothetical protein